MAKKKVSSDEKTIKFISMSVHVGDMLMDTAHMTDAEFGFYCRLLFTSWRNKGLPVDPNRLINIAGGASGTMDESTTAGLTTGNTDSTSDGTYGGHYTGTNRRRIWEYLKRYFVEKDTTDGLVLVNQRSEIERQKVIDYHTKQVENSLKGVEARRQRAKEREEREQLLQRLRDEEKTSTGGSTVGNTTSSTVSSTETVTDGIPNHKPGVSPIPTPIINKGEGEKVNKGMTNGATTGSTTGHTIDQLWMKLVPPDMKVYLTKTWEEFQTFHKVVTTGVTSEIFERWKRFVAFVGNQPAYHPLFQMSKFLEPKDYALVEASGFTERNWELVLDRCFKTGIEPKHKLWFRINDAIKALIKAGADLTGSQKQVDKTEFWEGVRKKQLELVDNLVKKKQLTKEQGDFVRDNIKPGEEFSEVLERWKRTKRSTTKQT